MAKCPRCSWNYDESVFMAPLSGSTFYAYQPICAICARAVREIIIGMALPWAEGGRAEQAEKAALAFRQTHDQDGTRLERRKKDR